MNEKETIERLEYILLKQEVSDKEEVQMRESMAKSFFESAAFFVSKFAVEFVEHPLWKFWKYVGTGSRVAGARITPGYDAKELDAEVSKYKNDGEVNPGSLSEKLDYCILSSGIKQEDPLYELARKVSVEAAETSLAYTIANVRPKIANFVTHLKASAVNSFNVERLVGYAIRFEQGKPLSE